MTFKQLADSIYIIPVLLDHFKKPTKLTAAILKEQGLEKKEIQQFRKVQDLLEYHMQFVKEGTQDYKLLQKGLAQYFDLFLSKLFQLSELTNKSWQVLDYGAGAGQVGKQFEADNPCSVVTSLDRKNEHGLYPFIEVDFEKKPTWHNDYSGKFDAVIMSELLHCKDKKGQQYLISSAHKLLASRGRFIVVENNDLCMAYRMNKIKKTDKLNIVTGGDLIQLVIGKFRPLTKRTIVNHQINVYEKI